MGNTSSLETLPEEVKEAYFSLIRKGRTINDICAWLADMGEERSRSAVGRHVKNAKAQMEKYKQAQAVAKTWIGKLEEDPEGDVGRLISEMLRVVAFQQLSDMGEDGGETVATPMDIMFIAKAIKEVASADKISADRIFRIRQEVKKEAVKAVEKVAKKGGISKETVEQARREILGIA